MIYLDSAATTLQKPPSVRRAVVRAMERCASVGRGGHAAAMAASEEVYACRALAAELFDAKPEQVVFTMNATHGLNLAIHSLVPHGGRVLISGFEHNAVTRPLYARNAAITVAGRKLFDREDTLRAFQAAMEAGDYDAVICTQVSNVFGYVLPLEEIAQLCRQRQIPLIVDASQSAGLLPVSLRQSGAAFIAMPGHKGLYGPQGTGLLLCAGPGKPLLYGGTGGNSLLREMPEFLPDRLEAGTHNVCGIAGLRAGLEFVRRMGPETLLRRERQLLQRLLPALQRLPLRCYTGKAQTGVLSFVPWDLDCEQLAERLGEQGIALRAGLHCAPLAHESAGTLEHGTLRLSLSAFTKAEELDRFVNISKILLGKKGNSRITPCY
ncbi:MAG: aminotransferase class V-fold PLP-dependent enzyme [Oscillospiraceae bacterium]|nr:aminotransferase class V-fold PLP-dependent enzyme [Oscillospiraceae bacterium]